MLARDGRGLPGLFFFDILKIQITDASNIAFIIKAQVHGHRGGNMKIKNIIVPALLLGFLFSPISAPDFAYSQKNPQKQKAKGKIKVPAEEKVYIPREVKSELDAGIEAREGRQDIPFTVFKHLYLPAQDNIHNIFLFKVINKDLEFKPLTVSPRTDEEKGEEQVEEPETPEAYRASFNIFLEFLHLKNNQPAEVAREVYIPATIEIEGPEYDPEKYEFYSTGYPLPPGNYLMAMAITSLDLERIGTFYLEFTNPDVRSFTDKLDTTPIFCVEDIEQMPSTEIRTEVHRGYFTYSILRIFPNFENVFAPGEKLDVFFFIYGTVPGADQRFHIEISYEVKKNDELTIRYEPQAYDTPLISQPLPMKQTMLITSETGEERRETRDLEPGNYILVIDIKDKISGNSATKHLEFEVKEEVKEEVLSS